MDPTVIQWIVTQGGLAAFAIWMLVRSFQDRIEERKQHELELAQLSLNERADKMLLLTAFDKNTEGRVAIAAKLDSMMELVKEQGDTIDSLRGTKPSDSTRSAKPKV